LKPDATKSTPTAIAVGVDLVLILPRPSLFSTEQPCLPAGREKFEIIEGRIPFELFLKYTAFLSLYSSRRL